MFNIRKHQAVKAAEAAWREAAAHLTITVWALEDIEHEQRRNPTPHTARRFVELTAVKAQETAAVDAAYAQLLAAQAA